MTADPRLTEYLSKGGVITVEPIKDTVEIIADVKELISKPNWRKRTNTVSPEYEIDTGDKY